MGLVAGPHFEPAAREALQALYHAPVPPVPVHPLREDGRVPLERHALRGADLRRAPADVGVDDELSDAGCVAAEGDVVEDLVELVEFFLLPGLVLLGGPDAPVLSQGAELELRAHLRVGRDVGRPVGGRRELLQVAELDEVGTPEAVLARVLPRGASGGRRLVRARQRGRAFAGDRLRVLLLPLRFLRRAGGPCGRDLRELRAHGCPGLVVEHGDLVHEEHRHPREPPHLVRLEPGEVDAGGEVGAQREELVVREAAHRGAGHVDPGRGDPGRCAGLGPVAVHLAPDGERLEEEALPGPRRRLDEVPCRLA